jgi:hypothetical protein
MRFEGVRLDQQTVFVLLENRDANPITHMRTRKHARPQGARSDRSEGQARTPKLQIPKKSGVDATRSTLRQATSDKRSSDPATNEYRPFPRKPPQATFSPAPASSACVALT